MRSRLPSRRSFPHRKWTHFRGPINISSLLALEGIKVSGVTVQRVLSDRNLSTKLQRWLALEKKGQEDLAQLSGEQTTFVEDQNPQFKERHVESGKPGELLNQDTYFVGHLGALGKVYLHTVVDTYGSMGWGLLHTTKKPEAAAAVLYNDVLPFYKKHRLTVENILTDNGREFCGTDTHPFQVFLALNDIGHRRIKPRTPRTNGFVERFHKTLGDEFFGPALRSKGYTSLDALQSDLDAWLDTYNYQRPHQGYRNHGRIPFATVQRFITTGDGLSTESATAVAALPRGEARASANLTRSPPKKSHARKTSVKKTK